MDELKLLAKDIKAALPGLELRIDEPMREHCSFKIGGPVSVMALPSSAEETLSLCERLRTRCGLKPLIVGNGTNLLVTDKPLRRFVIKMSDKMSETEFFNGNAVAAACGISLAKLAVLAAQRALSGLEFAHGIPGTLGGAVCMNAGAYGGEMKDVLKSVTFLDENLKTVTKAASELSFSYRHSVFSDLDCIVLGCEMTLSSGDEGEIFNKMRELSKKRRASQPLDLPSAGSAFKRPKSGFAAALIDESGLKGFEIGAAQVSEKHAGFIVNRGGASFDDVLKLLEHIKETVYQRCGIELEPEVKIIDG